ncbi:histidinol-phosphate aminotransferase [Thamnocephalis sphaerospora]|uniref:histidinol-phosphate transaminase n=1 Tax=Thamnocephalis sphaerospora TaxID=78915 RepID=A0A4P9XK40_9FUNG|nr:histidinol-phosphate aminotransferase [Thamnocephalis sphaerospora]|eukprot:RKP05590.1 histidinol-phosphate aminotransferase [Thamnocephalis sphaerospora]
MSSSSSSSSSSDFSVDDLVRPNIRALTPYRCARDDYNTGVLLDANENAYGPVYLRANQSARAPSKEQGYHRYPDPLNNDVKALYTAWRGLPGPEWAFFGVGSDEAIDLVMRVFGVPGKHKVLICPPTYGMYSVAAAVNDLGVVKVPLDVENARFQLRVDAILEATRADPDIRIMFLCSPGNPTGTCLAKSDIRRLLESDYRGIVVVDEAYVDFVDDDEEKGSVIRWTERYPNLIVMQTLSKSFGLAAIRLGIAAASPRIIHWMNVTKAPYNIPAPTAALAYAALSSTGLESVQSVVRQLRAERKRLTDGLLALPGVLSVFGNADANFLLCQIGDAQGQGQPDSARAERIYRWMADSGVVVRYRGNEYGCAGCLRISVGTPEESDAVLAQLSKALADEKLAR